MTTISSKHKYNKGDVVMTNTSYGSWHKHTWCKIIALYDHGSIPQYLVQKIDGNSSMIIEEADLILLEFRETDKNHEVLMHNLLALFSAIGLISFWFIIWRMVLN